MEQFREGFTAGHHAGFAAGMRFVRGQITEALGETLDQGARSARAADPHPAYVSELERRASPRVNVCESPNQREAR